MTPCKTRLCTVTGQPCEAYLLKYLKFEIGNVIYQLSVSDRIEIELTFRFYSELPFSDTLSHKQLVVGFQFDTYLVVKGHFFHSIWPILVSFYIFILLKTSDHN